MTMEATLNQLKTKHLLDNWYAVLERFTEPRTRNEAWRYSSIGHKGTFFQIVKDLLKATFLLKTGDGRLIITDSGRNWLTLTMPLITSLSNSSGEL